LIQIHHLPENARFAADEVVGEDDGEWVISHHLLGAQHRVPQTQRLGLADVHDRCLVRQYILHHVQQIFLSIGFEFRLKLVGLVKMVLDGTLVAASNENRSSMPAAIASSAAYWISGLSTIGAFPGLAFVAGRKRVPRPATGNTALVTRFIILIPDSRIMRPASVVMLIHPVRMALI
jgi:hypothetical protein